VNGARQVEGTINGIGERAGNAALEEVVMALRTRARLLRCAHRHIEARELCRTSRLVADMLGMMVPANKAVVGGNAFRAQLGHPRGWIPEGARDLRDHAPGRRRLAESRVVLTARTGRHGLPIASRNLDTR
jgi:2-isopropylmalate synthase